jgi:hypothetical protein
MPAPITTMIIGSRTPRTEIPGLGGAQLSREAAELFHAPALAVVQRTHGASRVARILRSLSMLFLRALVARMFNGC